MAAALVDRSHPLLGYITIPSSAQIIHPSGTTTGAEVIDPTSTKPSFRSRLASFPPASSSSVPAPKGKPVAKDAPSTGFMAGTLSNSVSDMILGSILPSTIPKSAAPTTKTPFVPGRPKGLSSQKDGLSLQVMTTNFRRFVARCGPAFWVQDRVEEVLYWRKPMWTYAWMLAWCFISFYPRTLLLLPSLTILLILLNSYNKAHPSPAHFPTPSTGPSTTRQFLLSNPLAASIGASLTQNKDSLRAEDDPEEVTLAHGSTVDDQGKEVPAVPAGTAESGVDYYMNLQAIQNLMGLVSDAHDAVLPYISLISPSTPNPTPLPTSFPISPTHLTILLLPPTLLLPLLPASSIPFLLLPLGILPPILFHPAFSPSYMHDFAASVPRGIRFWRAKAERWVLTDRLEEGIAKSEIREVNVWENERLDPGWTPAAPSKEASSDPVKLAAEKLANSIPSSSAWSSSHLKSSDRQAWVRTIPPPSKENLWKDDVISTIPEEDEDVVLSNQKREKDSQSGKMALVLAKGWSFVPGEEWRVDFAGAWSGVVGTDEDGWMYTDDEWKVRRKAVLVIGSASACVFEADLAVFAW